MRVLTYYNQRDAVCDDELRRTDCPWVGMDTLGVIEFYALCEGAETVNDVAGALFDAARRIGFAHASYVCGGAPDDGDPGFLLTNYPDEWRRRYQDSRYRSIDPIISRAHRTIEPFIWGDPIVLAGMSPKQLRMMEEARAFHVGHGYAVPVHSSLHVRAACFFASEHNDIHPTSCRASRRISVIAHEHICRLAKLSEGRREAPQLSAREGACLNLYARGLGDLEIAATLDIRLPTVRRHFDQARRRLGVATRQEALVRALTTGQIA